MITDYGFVLARGDKGFRHFLKYTLFEVEKCISNFESKGISRTLEWPDNYVVAFIKVDDDVNKILAISITIIRVYDGLHKKCPILFFWRC